MELRLYDTLTREKRPFQPLDPNRVRMYVCGPTVYDFAHIGNARPVIVFDVLFRLLRHLAKQGVWDGGKGETEVVYVRNITDVDDKINARAAERGISIRDLTEETYQNFKEDVKALGCLPPSHEPRATEFVSNADASVDMIRLIERLIANGHAYVAEGHVLFGVGTMSDYGRLSKRPLDEMIAGARVEVAPYKRDPMDFVLWKPSPPELPGWDSPWGRGRPGWHIECSAMSAALLGETFDIHGGGIDLVFPHHENEIAQSRCAFHAPVMANYWMHNGFLQVEGRKMAKSEGNFITIRQANNDWDGIIVRFAMLLTHYRQPLDWTTQRLKEASLTIERLKRWYEPDEYPGFEPDYDRSAPYPPFLEALCDDLNTVEAMTRLYELIAQIDATSRSGDLDLPKKKSMFSNSLRLLGFDNITNYDYNKVAARRVYGGALDEAHVQSQIDARNAARKARNFKEADRIRDELKAMGVELEDKKDGTTVWKVK
jgi:cysteinyl-tRNA synthetase